MHLRTISAEGKGGLIEVRLDRPEPAYHLIDPAVPLGDVNWVDARRVLVGVGGDLALVDVETGAQLGRAEGGSGSTVVVAPGAEGFWSIGGGGIARYTLPDLAPVRRSHGIERVDADRWRLIDRPDALPDTDIEGQRYHDDVRDFRELHGPWVAAEDGTLVGTAPPGGRDHADRQVQGTELMRIDAASGEVVVRRLPGDLHAPTRSFTAISPDGRHALRPSLEPVFRAASGGGLFRKLLGKADYAYPRRAGAPGTPGG